MAEDSEYVLELFRQGVDFTLFRGAQRADKLPIFALALPTEQPLPGSLRRLEHEFSLASELGAAWAAQPLALSSHQGRSVLILRDPGGEPLDGVIERSKGQAIDLTRFLRIAIGFASALSQAHRQGLIHKDVKPANALVDESGHVWLTGFGFASRLARERQSPEAPEFIAGSLPYMAPEQTGRMNRSIDSRSDLYSLGITLYEISTGKLPFTASDPMGWVHCQIARQPVSPFERVPSIQGPVSDMIMKLLAKNAEERYQTAVGLKRDFQRCLEEWETHGRIDPFPLGEHDQSDRLLIPEKLYGRATEVEALLASFDRVMGGGRPELVLVSGYSGVGKSSVVNELHKSLVPPRGLFASGKFDPYKRDIPYATIAQAFQSLIRPILAKNERELSRWRDAIQEALGTNGQILVDLVPELQLIIGEQQPVPELAPQDAQSRFQLAFRRFIGAFTHEHPVALFLDDLQWLDAATLNLLEHLLTHPDVSQLMLIGAYRDNEVNPTHPLMRTLEAVRATGGPVHEIVLAPLTRGDLEEIIADSLHCERDRAEPLAELIEEKTAGNPFFAIQFISALAEESLLSFDYGKGEWAWDLNRIHAKGYTENVVDLMRSKLNRLPIETQKALQQLACLGNKADFAMLHTVYQDSIEEMHGQLWEAVRSGLIFRSEDSYRFLHDRAQEAAYLLIPDELRAEMHLRIGMQLLAHTPLEMQEEHIFEIVNQLNRGSHLLTSAEEHERVAGLNLTAGRRAKASIAYISALKYLRAGRTLLTKPTSELGSHLIFSIECLMAECELLTAEMVLAEKRLTALSQLAKTGHDLAVVTRLQLTLYTTLDQSERAIEVFLDYLRRGGTDWSKHPTHREVMAEYDCVWSLLENRPIEELLDLPLLKDPDVIDMLDVFTEIVHPAMFYDENLSSLAVCRMVNLSLKHGNCDGSCFGYVWFAMFAGPRFNNYKDGFRFGQLGYDLVEKRGLRRYQARTYITFSTLMPWAKHAASARELVRRAFDIAYQTGDLTFSAYSWHVLITNYLTVGDPLQAVQPEAETGLAFATKQGFGLVAANCGAQLGLIRTLRGLTLSFGCFDDETYSESESEVRFAGNPGLALAEFFYWTRKLQGRFFAGDYAAAIDASQRAHPLLWPAASQVETGDFRFYSALAHAATWGCASAAGKRGHFDALIEHHRQLEIWAEHCPSNFDSRATLVSAEIARVEERFLDAESLYEKAIRSAHANGFVHNEAVANELAGRFYLARGIETAGYAYLRDARHCYKRWGALGKIRQLDELYTRLREERTHTPSTTIGPLVGQLDVETVVKASQAISSEIVLPKLIERLMRIAVEHAGAQRGLLILLRGGVLWIEAEAGAGAGNRIEVTVRQAPIAPSDLAESILNFVIRTQERVLLDDASSDEVYSADDYVKLKRSRSVLCLPIVKQAKLVGALYLENSLTPGAFTPDRVTILQLLASQAAISLENAALYTDLQRSEAFLAQGQRISHNGSFGWSLASGEFLWSEELYNIFEYDPGTQASTELAVSRMHPDDRDRVRRLLDTARKEGKDFDSEHRLLMPDGRMKHLHTTGRAVNTGNLDFMGAVRDVTERVRAQEALRQVQADLAHVARVATLNAIAASIAHEVNQPLSGILTNANTCVRMLAAEPPNLMGAAETARRTIRDANRASEVIKRLRAMFSKETPTTERVDLNDAAQEVITLSAGELQRSRVLLQTEFSADIPLVSADRVQLQQVILNLLLNAADAMAEVDNRPRQLLVQTQLLDDGSVKLAVRDSGTGVDPHTVEKLFEAFYTTKTDGMGVGLSICRSIIESHNGRLWAEANDGLGATFSFCVPTVTALPITAPQSGVGL
jgi:predicted ATPase/signal transduction histidine kinase